MPIIKDSLVYPVVLDAERTVLSLPPIINGAHSAVRPHRIMPHQRLAFMAHEQQQKESRIADPVIYGHNLLIHDTVGVQISLQTRDIFIECTATDLTKARVVLNTVTTMFSEYCSTAFEVEPVEVVDALGQSRGAPQRDMRSHCLATAMKLLEPHATCACSSRNPHFWCSVP